MHGRLNESSFALLLKGFPEITLLMSEMNDAAHLTCQARTRCILVLHYQLMFWKTKVSLA